MNNKEEDKQPQQLSLQKKFVQPPDLSTSQKQDKPQSPFSPTNSSQMSNFFNPRGPIKPQNLLQGSQNQSAQQQQNKPPLGFVRQSSQQQQNQRMGNEQIEMDDSDEYGQDDDQNDEYDDEIQMENNQRSMQIIMKLEQNSNQEFKRVIRILQSDPELTPLIFEHQMMLVALKDMNDLKAEQMLSILTAAEQEMYDNSRIRDEHQQLQQQMQASGQSNKQMATKAVEANFDQAEREVLFEKNKTANFEIEKLKAILTSLENQNLDLTNDLNIEKESRDLLEKEKECTFKNLSEENKQLKKMNETFRKNEIEAQRILEQKQNEFNSEVGNIKKRLKEQEDLRNSMFQDKNKLEVNMKRNQEFIENLENEIKLLEQDNDNLHRKMNLTYNSLLFQSQLNNQLMNINGNGADESTPARRNLSNSFQASGLILEGVKDRHNNFAPSIAYGNSTNKIKLLMSENKNGNSSSLIRNSYIYNQQYNFSKEGGDFNQNQLVRCNSIEVLLLTDDEQKKQNMYIFGEEEKQSSMISGSALQNQNNLNKQSWLRTKALFTDLSPINSLGSHQIDPSSHSRAGSSSYQNQIRKKKLQDVEEEQTEILGTHQASPYYPQTKFMEEQVKKLQQEIDKLRNENNELTVKLQSQTFNIAGLDKAITQGTNQFQSSPGKFQFTSNQEQILGYATPQNSNIYKGGILNNNLTSEGANQQFYNQQQIQQQLQNQQQYTSMRQMQQQDFYTQGANQSPLMMATFSKEKDRDFYAQQLQSSSFQPKTSEGGGQQSDSSKILLEQQFDRLTYEFKSKLSEVGGRLINLFKKFGPINQEVDQLISQGFSISLLKDLIYEIQNKVEQIFDQQKSYKQSQGSYIFSGGAGLNTQYQQQWGGPQSHGGFASNNNSTALEMTAMEYKNMLVEEKEKRLMVQEELQRTQKDFQRFLSENEKLKQELYNEKMHNQTMAVSHLEMHSQNNDNLSKQNMILNNKVDNLQDENISLKLKNTDLEGELFEWRKGLELRHDHSFLSMKSQIEQQFSDYKQRSDNQLMNAKEEIHKLKIEMQGLLERNLLLKEHLSQFRERIQELEKENISQSKENYILQNELEYENLRASQLQGKSEKVKNEMQNVMKIDKGKTSDILSKYEFKLKELQFKLSESEITNKRIQEINKISKEAQDDEVYRLRTQNTQMQDELQSLRYLTKINNYVEPNNKNIQQPKENIQNSQKSIQKKFATVLLQNLSRHKQKLSILKKFYNLKVSAQVKKSEQIQNLASFGSGALSENNLFKITQLEEQLFRWQSQNQQLCLLIGKVLKQLSQGQKIKLNLNGLVSKLTLNDILSGLKNNVHVKELNISNCELDDEDLQKVLEILKNDEIIEKLKIGNNKFSSSEYLFEIIQQKGSSLTSLDISGFQFDPSSLSEFSQNLNKLEIIENLNMQNIITKNEGLNNQKEIVRLVIDSTIKLKTLKSIDLSKNKFQLESLEHFLYSLRNAQNIESIQLNNCGVTQKLFDSTLFMVQNQRFIKQLSLSGNQLTSTQLTQIILSLKSCNSLEDLDLSMSQFNNDQNCFKALAELISENKQLKTLILQKCKINDNDANCLINAFSQAYNLEIIKLDFNKLSSTFFEKLVQKILANKQNFVQQDNRGNNYSQLSNDDSDLSFISSSIMDSTQRKKQRKQLNSWMFLSVEGNQIGDKGVASLANLLRTPLQITKCLRKINLNECDITYEGFEELRNALMQRANLAQIANLTHVRITIDRNNIQ